MKSKTFMKRFCVFITLVLILTAVFSTSLMSFAAETDSSGTTSSSDASGSGTGDLSGVLEEMTGEIKAEGLEIAENSIFPLIQVVLVVFFFLILAFTGISYHQKKEINYVLIAVILFSLIVSFLAVTFLPKLVG